MIIVSHFVHLRGRPCHELMLTPFQQMKCKENDTQSANLPLAATRSRHVFGGIRCFIQNGNLTFTFTETPSLRHKRKWELQTQNRQQLLSAPGDIPLLFLQALPQQVGETCGRRVRSGHMWRLS